MLHNDAEDPCRRNADPAALLDREGHPYTIKMKVRFPGFGPWYSLLNRPASNDSDSADNDGDDTEMYWADVKVYDGIVD